jgi:hypothetical protein
MGGFVRLPLCGVRRLSFAIDHLFQKIEISGLSRALAIPIRIESVICTGRTE